MQCLKVEFTEKNKITRNLIKSLKSSSRFLKDSTSLWLPIDISQITLNFALDAQVRELKQTQSILKTEKNSQGQLKMKASSDK